MNNSQRYRKFQPQQRRIEELGKNNDRFRRIYSEYQNLTEELWNLENSDGPSVPDDFINSFKLQASYLEDEIEDWLLEDGDEL